MPRQRIDWFGPKLRSLREEAGISQAELGKMIGVSGSQINKLETNVNQPMLSVALALAQALGVECTAFTQEFVERPPAKPGRPRKAEEPAAEEPKKKPRKKKET